MFFFCKNIAKAQEDPYTILNKHGDVQEYLTSINKRLDALNEDIFALQQNETSIETQLENSKTDLREKSRKKEITQIEIEKLVSEIMQQNSEYKKSLKQLDERASILKTRLITLQDQGTYKGYLPILLESSSISSFLDRVSAIVTFINAEKQLVTEIEKEQEHILDKKRELEKNLLRLDQMKTDLLYQIQDIEQGKAHQEELIHQIRQSQAVLIQEKKQLEEQNKELLRDQQSLGAQSLKNYQTISLNYVKGVPEEYLPYYVSAGNKYGVDWYVLAAIHATETSYSTHPTMISSANAVGHMQFMKLTWVGNLYDTGNGQPPPDLDITDLKVIQRGNGYGTDGDGDGKADPFNLADSIESAAKYLAKNGYATNPAKAIWHYNHAQWYVDKVLAEAQKIKQLNT